MGSPANSEDALISITKDIVPSQMKKISRFNYTYVMDRNSNPVQPERVLSFKSSSSPHQSHMPKQFKLVTN